MTRTKALLVVLAFLAASAGFADWRVVILSGHVARNQESDTRALCSFRADLQGRVKSSNDFLRTHPRGIPGVSARVIQQGITNQQATLRALRPLVC